MPSSLQNVPRGVIIAVVPLLAFLVAAGISFGIGGNDDDDDQASALATATATQAVAQASTPQASPTALVTATPLPDRTSCSEIQGTEYRSEAEQAWYQENCASAPASASTGGTQSASSSSVPSGGSGGNPTAGAPSIPAGSEYALGDRLIIPAAGVNAPVSGIRVGTDGAMPNPSGYFNALWYDFSALPGLGGYVNGGNIVLAGHVDCARCHNGSSGSAVFYNVRYLSPGDQVTYITSNGQQYNYVVFSNQNFSPNADFAGIVSTAAADMTLITCTGTFVGGDYDTRNVVFLRKA
jgi:hypothetical protein